MSQTKSILTGYLVIYLLAAGTIATAGAMVDALSYLVTSAHAGSFYPACLKPDGDWLHGVTRKECMGKDVHGRWFTKSVLKKAQKVM